MAFFGDLKRIRNLVVVCPILRFFQCFLQRILCEGSKLSPDMCNKFSRDLDQFPSDKKNLILKMCILAIFSGAA